MAKNRTPLFDRFWPKVLVGDNNECWPWLARIGIGGYGEIRDDNQKSIGAHRAAYILAYGDIPEGLFILHSCDNPRCVNPKHLRAGDHSENMRDRAKRNRARGRRGASHHSAKITEGEARTILVRVAAGEKQKVIAESLGVSNQLVNDVCRGKTWSHIGIGV